MLHDISHLKLITYYAKLKTYLKEGTKHRLGFILGFLISYLLFICCLIIEIIFGSYGISIGLGIFSLLPLLFLCCSLPNFLYHVYNSTTYSLDNLKYNSNYIIHKSKKYYIITSLKHNMYLVQDITQLKQSKKFPVNYKIFYLNISTSSEQVLQDIYSCSENVSHNTPKHFRYLCLNAFFLIVGIMLLVLMILLSFYYILGHVIIRAILHIIFS